MTFDFYKTREDVARAFDGAADAVREEKKNAGEESVGKYVHIKRQLRRAIWEEEDSPAERFDRTLVLLFNLYAETADAMDWEIGTKRELFFYLKGYLLDELCRRLDILHEDPSTDAFFWTMLRMTANRRSSEEYQRGERLRQKIEKEEKEGGTE